MSGFNYLLKNSLPFVALFSVALTVSAQSAIERQIVETVPVESKAPKEDAIVKYTYPGDSYYISFDTGEGLNTVPKGPISLVTAPWTHILFEDISTMEGTGEWFINNGKRNEETWEPEGEDTPLVADENGNYNYFVEGPRDDFYRAPILKYGDKKYRLSDESLAVLTDYCNSGIKATYNDITMTLLNIKYGGNNWYDFSDLSRFGGKTLGSSFPSASSNMISDDKTSIDFICDGDETTFFNKLGPTAEGDRWIVDCGDTLARHQITIKFSDAEHLLHGKASVFLGNDIYSMEELGQYTVDQVKDNVFTIDAGGKKARIIEFRATAKPDEESVTQITEIKEENMHVFSVPGVLLVYYPMPVSNMGHYQNNVIENLTDDDPSTIYWNGSAQAVDSYVMIDCGESVARNKIKMVFCDGDKPGKGVIEISSDNENWEQLAEVVGTDLSESNSYTVECDAQGKEARYVRFRITEESSYWLKVADFIVEGAREFTGEMEAEPMYEKFITYYPKPVDPFYLDMVSMFACSYDNSNKVLPVGQELKMAVLKVNEDNSLGDTIGLSKITVSDIKRKPFIYNMGPECIVLDWKFYNEPEDGIGVPEQIGLLIDSPFAIVVYDTDQVVGLNLAMQFGYRESVLTGDYGLAKYKYRKDDEESSRGGFSYWWNLFGSFKTLRADELCQTMFVELKGGNAQYKNADGEMTSEGVFYSYIPMNSEDVKIEKPEWLNCTFGETKDGKTTFTIVADPASENREGEIVITTDLGVVAQIKVIQNETGSAINNVESKEQVSVVRNGDVVIVNYPDTYSKLSVYSINGSLVSEYALDGNGTLELSDDSFKSHGVYIIRLEGDAKPYVVKVVK